MISSSAEYRGGPAPSEADPAIGVLSKLPKSTALELVAKELKRRLYLEQPELWVRERLNEFVWSKQVEILQSVRRFRKTAVMSCHQIGKSFTAARVAGWWLDAHPPGTAFVVTSAPSAAQIKAILWREIGHVHTAGKLFGRVNQTEWITSINGGREELVAFGRKPDDYDPTAFQGIHAPYVLVIFDEANGVRGPLWDAADSLIANDDSKFLTIGNPDEPVGEFYDSTKSGSGWNVVQVGAFDSPNFSGEKVPRKVAQSLVGRLYVEERRKKWASNWTWTEDGRACVMPPEGKLEDTHPFWQSKILGIFPSISQDARTLIPLPWIRAAQQRTIKPEEPSELGVDVGGGGDSNTIAHRRGSWVRITREDKNPDTMQTCDNVVQALIDTKSRFAKVDVIGIGRGVVDRGKELERPFIGINVSQASFEPERFYNLRAQFWWYVRTLFELGQIDIDPADEGLEEELASLRYKSGPRGQIIMESKDEARRRGIASPNRADALMLAFAEFGTSQKISCEMISNIAKINDELVGDSRWGFAQ